MQYTECRQGRVFVVRLEQGDLLPQTVELFARNLKIRSALVYLLGGADKGSRIISGPQLSDPLPSPMNVHRNRLAGVHELLGLGTLFLNQKEMPVLHLHAACGRKDETITGCIREGVPVWLYMEAVIVELLQCDARRKVDPKTGFTLLDLNEA